MSKLNIIFISNTSTDAMIEYMFSKKLGVTNLASQKYHKLLMRGLVGNGVNVNILSVPDVNNNNGKFIFSKSIENELGVNFTSVPVVFIPVLKVLFMYLTMLFYFFKISSRTKGTKVIAFDILNTKTALFSFLISKLFYYNSIVIVTDKPECMYIFKDNLSYLDKLTLKIQNFILTHTDKFVFLTPQAEKSINYLNKKYCIIEGMCDNSILNYIEPKFNSIKVIHYSGGLFYKFGVKNLVDAFAKIKDENIRLHIFGVGELLDYIKQCAHKDNRIKYFGYKPNSEILLDQSNSTLLVNPRYSNEEYTLYSFPSKTIEYMSSGVPLLTTKLKGIPEEYFDYVYLLSDETEEGLKCALIDILSIDKNQLKVFGNNARTFVLNKKNNVIQAKKLFNLFDDDSISN
jgi:glycosyltransferase involved in cell wall biosynthesis